MKQLLNNILSVLLWRPDRYRPLRHEAQAAALFGIGTTVLGLWLIGLPALFVVGIAYLVALVTFPCKILMASDVPPAALATESVFARGAFAGSVSSWPVGLAIAAGLPTLVIVVIALHAMFEVWMQVLPRQELATGFAARSSEAGEPPGRAPGGPRFRQAGPPVGRFDGREIPSWLLDEQGVYHDYVGCTSDAVHHAVGDGQTLLGTGLIYEVRRAAPAEPD